MSCGITSTECSNWLLMYSPPAAVRRTWPAMWTTPQPWTLPTSSQWWVEPARSVGQATSTGRKSTDLSLNLTDHFCYHHWSLLYHVLQFCPLISWDEQFTGETGTVHFHLGFFVFSLFITRIRFRFRTIFANFVLNTIAFASKASSLKWFGQMLNSAPSHCLIAKHWTFKRKLLGCDGLIVQCI